MSAEFGLVMILVAFPVYLLYKGELQTYIKFVTG